ncbi:lateral signaling target protein [Spatholobus suberectus]|nr:lateral signaling target protein [Spatholobus suberectus]
MQSIISSFIPIHPPPSCMFWILLHRQSRLDLSTDINEGIEGLMTCTKSLGFQSIDINDEIDDDDNNNDEDEDDCRRRMRLAEGRGNFPPPLSSLNGNGQPSFVLLPVRKNGRLQLSKVRIKRPKILYATRQDGRLRLFLIADQCVEDNAEEEEEEQELVDDVEERMAEEEDEEDDEVVEEITSYEQNDIRVGEWMFHNEGLRKCH